MDAEYVDKKRKITDVVPDSQHNSTVTDWNVLQTIMENYILHDKISGFDVAVALLSKWFTIVATDHIKLHTFRQWIIPNSVTNQLDDVLTSAPLSLSSVHLSDKAANPELSPDSQGYRQLLHQLLRQQQHQIAILQQMRRPQDVTSSSVVPSAYLPGKRTITLTPNIGYAGDLIVVTMASEDWHSYSSICECVCKFTTDGVSSTAPRIAGGGEGQMRFVVPKLAVKVDDELEAGIISIVHLIMCSAPSTPVPCAVPFFYTHRESSNSLSSKNCSSIGSDSDETSEPAEDEDHVMFAGNSSSNGGYPLATPGGGPGSGSHQFVPAGGGGGSARPFVPAGGSPPTDSFVPAGGLSPSKSPVTVVAPYLVTPKLLITIREKMTEHTKSLGDARYPQPHSHTYQLIVQQRPTAKIAWKNRRFDIPFKVSMDRVSVSANVSTTAPVPVAPHQHIPVHGKGEEWIALAIVSDHKGRIQTDAVENYVEEFNSVNCSVTFNNLRMTKGTWGKEWNITFVACSKDSLSSDDPAVLAISSPCSIVVKTRKNPQIRNNGPVSSSSPPSPVAFVERRPIQPHPRKRNRVEDLLSNSFDEQMDMSVFRDPGTPASDGSSTLFDPTTSSSTSTLVFSRETVLQKPQLQSQTSDSEAMMNLLCAAELKQNEICKANDTAPPSTSGAPLPSTNTTTTPPLSTSPMSSFSGLQHLVTLLEEVKIKHHPSLVIIEQPQLEHHDSKTFIVKKGKPFRTTLMLRSDTIQDSPTFHSAEQYICVAILRNEKGEELTLKNNEVHFDQHGKATFPGLTVMKGTWGKAVLLTFEARWANHTPDVQRLPLKMLTIAESKPIMLMCFTKAPKT